MGFTGEARRRAGSLLPAAEVRRGAKPAFRVLRPVIAGLFPAVQGTPTMWAGYGSGEQAPNDVP